MQFWKLLLSLNWTTFLHIFCASPLILLYIRQQLTRCLQQLSSLPQSSLRTSQNLEQNAHGLLRRERIGFSKLLFLLFSSWRKGRDAVELGLMRCDKVLISWMAISCQTLPLGRPLLRRFAVMLHGRVGSMGKGLLIAIWWSLRYELAHTFSSSFSRNSLIPPQQHFLTTSCPGMSYLTAGLAKEMGQRLRKSRLRSLLFPLRSCNQQHRRGISGSYEW